VLKFDGSNLPLWKSGLDLALHEYNVQIEIDGTCLIFHESLVEKLNNMGETQTLLQICTTTVYTLPPHLRGFIAI
jgi:hypothetical protein